MIALRAFALLVTSVVLVLGAGPASSQPQKCDYLPGSFVPVARSGLNPIHQAAINAIRVRDSKAAQQIAPLLQTSIAQSLTRESAPSLNAAFMRVDLANLLALFPGLQYSETIQQLRRDALASLSSAKTLAGVETAIQLRMTLDQNKSDAEKHAAAVRNIDAHRHVAGDALRAVPLWSIAIADASGAELDRLTKQQLEAAERVSNSRWLLKARVDRIRAAVKTIYGKDPEGAPHAVWAQAASKNPEALELARAAILALEQRVSLPTQVEGSNCQWYERKEVDIAATYLITAGTQPERLKALRVAVLGDAQMGPFGTDWAGGLYNMLAVLASRTVDKQLYWEGLRLTAKNHPEECQLYKAAPELCALTTLIDGYSDLANGGAAVPLVQDAIDLLKGKVADPQIRTLVLVQSATVQWNFGSAAEGDRLLTEAERLIEANPSSVLPNTTLKAAQLRARIADAQMDDSRAADAMRRIVRIAIDRNRSRGKNGPGPRRGDADTEQGTADAAYHAAEELVHSFIRRRFCAGCDDALGATAAVVEWFSALTSSRADSGFVPSDIDFLLQFTLRPADWSKTQRAHFSQRYKELVLKTAATYSRNDLQIIAKALPKSDQDGQLRVYALSRLETSDSSDVAKFLTFLLEPDLQKKRALWKAYMDSVSSDLDQFGQNSWRNTNLDALARGLLASGYRIAARVVFERLVDRRTPGAARGVLRDQADLKLIVENASTMAPALVQLAEFARQSKDWELTHRLLDLAGQVSRQKLVSEWRSGNERIAAGLSALRGALRYGAQIRARALLENANNPTSAELHGKLFSDLQMSMFSDTASVAQIVDRRRAASNAQLADAFKRRDEIIAAIEGYANEGVAAGAFNLTTTDDNVRKLKIAEAEAHAEIKKLMPLGEEALSPSPMSIVEAKAALRRNEAVLMLHTGSDAVYGQLITKDSDPISWISPIGLAALETKVQNLRAGVDVTAGFLPQFPFDEARSLYNILVGPAETKLSQIDSLFVVGDGPLNSMPFGILTTGDLSSPPATPNEFRDAKIPWLARKFAVVTLTGVNSLKTRGAKQFQSSAKLAFAGIGAPSLSGAPGSTRGGELPKTRNANGIIDVSELKRLAALPETETEIKTLGGMLRATKDDLKIGASATEAAVKRMPLQNYKVITFATHGLVAGSVRGASEPGLVLTPPENPTVEDDGFLAASEVAALKLDAELVLLSACNTASTDGRPRAEGLSGLARAFLSAGARAVVASHWAIPSAPTVELTSSMIAERQGSRDVTWGVALRRAMLKMIDSAGPAEFAHPANWGAFVVVGVGD